MVVSEEFQEEHWEERTLNLLHDSKIDQQLLESKYRKRSCKKHKLRWMKRPMAITGIILELQDQGLRENALRCLSNYLLEKREEEPENYHRTGNLLYNSCGTVTILLQEVQAFYGCMVNENVNVRSSKRVVNVLTLFQSIAANPETRNKFVNSHVPDFLIPLILFKNPLEVFDNVRAVALSVIGILCQTRDHEIIQWAIHSNMIEICTFSIEIGNELSKVIGMHILEAMLRDPAGLSHICHPMCSCLLDELMKTLENLVNLVSIHDDFSPRLLFHILRCYVLLCNHVRGNYAVKVGLPCPIMDGVFYDIIEEFPVIRGLFKQLVLGVGEENDIP